MPPKRRNTGKPGVTSQDRRRGKNVKNPSNGGGKAAVNLVSKIRSTEAAAPTASNRVKTRRSSQAVTAPSVPVDGDPRPPQVPQAPPLKDKEKPCLETNGKSSAVQKASNGRSTSGSSRAPVDTAGHDHDHESELQQTRNEKKSSGHPKKSVTDAEPGLEDPTPTRSRSIDASNKRKRLATSGLELGLGLELKLDPLPKKRRGGHGGGRPKKQLPEGLEVEPKKPRGRPRKPQQALEEGGSRALVVSPDRAGRAKVKRQSEEKSVSQWSSRQFVEGVLYRMENKSRGLNHIAGSGWKNALEMKAWQLEKSLQVFLISLWDETNHKFVVNNDPIDIRDYIQKVLGYTNGATIINFVPRTEKAHPLYTNFTRDGRSIQCKDAYWMLENDDVDPLEYCTIFILHAFGHYINPHAVRSMDRQLLSIFSGVTYEMLKDMNWCDFIAEVTVKALDDYKLNLLKDEKDRAKHKMCGGCLGVLAAIFYDLVTGEIGDTAFPRVNHITDADLQKLNKATNAELKEFERKAKKMCESLYTNDYEVKMPEDRAAARPEDRAAA